ncbi:uncharacterized protein LOC134225303 [Armigeres subalbatus]|uniref:uncharacterized protein LOC134225303 n=1 Tax=Armigeres subalbatus TaxID=124917 RepID=UPI002ED3EE59
MLPRSEIAPLLKKAVDRMENLTSTLENGFKRCGLFPFNADSVNYSSLTSGSCKESSIMAPNFSQNDTLNAVQTLYQFESYLSQQQLKCFMQSQTGNWTGPVEDTGLFTVWKRMRDDTAGKSGETSSILETENICQLSEDEEPPFMGFPEAEIDVQGRIRDSENSVAHTLMDILNTSFPKPKKVQDSKPKKHKIHPPSVATGKAYEEYIEKIEKQKKEDELKKQKKKIERLLKKAAKEESVTKKRLDKIRIKV